MNLQQDFQLPDLHSIYLISGRRAMVVHADDSIIRLETELYNRTISLEPVAFRKEIQSGEIRLLQKMSFNMELQAFSGMTEKQEKDHQRKLHYVKFFTKHCGHILPRNGFEELRHQAAALINDPRPFGYVQMSKHCKKYWASGQSETSLIGPQQMFGRRASRLAEEVHDIMATCISEHYLQPTRPSLQHLTRIIRGKIIELNSGQYRTRPLQIPSYGTVCTAVDRIDGFHLTSRREGMSVARKENKRGRPIEYEQRIGARVEADTQLLDIMVYHEEFEIALRPYLTALIDVASRCVIGWDISFSHPSAPKTLRALCQAMVASPDVETRAVPETLIVDNGKEFVNTNMMSLSKDISILYRQASPRAPDQKAFVERVFHTFNLQFFHTLPGTTKSSPSHRGDYDSGAEAAINIFDLRRLFGQYLSEVYHHGKHSTLGCSPIEKWRELERQVPPRTLTEEEVRFKTCIRENCSIHHGRVKAQNMQWEGPGLPQLATRLKSCRNNLKAVLLIDTNQIGKAWVQDPTGKSPIQEVTNTLPHFYHSLSLAEIKLAQEFRKTESAGKANDKDRSSLDVAVSRLFRDVAEVVKGGRGKKEARKLLKVVEKFPSDQLVNSVSSMANDSNRLKRQMSLSLEAFDGVDHLVEIGNETEISVTACEQDLHKLAERKMKKIYQQRSES